MHGNAKDLTGQRFGRLVAIKPIEKRLGGNIVWYCLCDCGNECFVRSNHLKMGAVKSYGCLILDTMTIHGKCYTKIYKIWVAMNQRCENPKCKAFKNYGGRGIKVCERWHSFENFYADVGDPPEGKTLDRWPNNDGDYELSNFRWASRREQRLNCRPTSCGPAKQRWFFAYNENTGEWDEDNNQREFARRWNLRNTLISDCFHNRQKTHKGWTFKWLSKPA